MYSMHIYYRIPQVFEDCRVPRENLVGQRGGAAVCMMRNLEIERLYYCHYHCYHYCYCYDCCYCH